MSIIFFGTLINDFSDTNANVLEDVTAVAVQICYLGLATFVVSYMQVGLPKEKLNDRTCVPCMWTIPGDGQPYLHVFSAQCTGFILLIIVFYLGSKKNFTVPFWSVNRFEYLK
jgi:hypothetical protein